VDGAGNPVVPRFPVTQGFEGIEQFTIKFGVASRMWAQCRLMILRFT
jgi:hypothetical protein